MDGTGSVKVPDGKLVRVHATYDDRIESVRITGDFFLEPPEALEDLEAALEGQPADASEDDLRAAVDGVDAQLIGFDAGDLAAATVEAVR
ncbi:MAG TPA: lipoate protein ligase C-terminal domain-containing protein [Natrialbaceae archaeon]|nr:lipoate protein ligase C-terminal domain-containing protein [Natrialbaceae archaeon]